MDKIVAVVNQKGGVGKTTTAVNLATALAAIQKNVLLIDLDPQGNASTGLGIDSRDRERNIYDVVIEGRPISDCVRQTIIPRLSVVPSTIDLSGAELELVGMEKREFRLKQAVAGALSSFDYVIIDCPPSLGLLTLNALVASNSVLIPLQCEFYALEGLGHLLRTVELVRKGLNRELSIHGVVLTMYDKRNRLTEHVENDVRGVLGDKVFKTVIPRNVRISEAPSFGKPAIVYDHKCPGSKAYIKLASEIIHRDQPLKPIAA